MKTNVKLAQKRALLRVKFHGDPIRIRWTEWSSAPVVDGTTGATPQSPGTERIVDTRALVHTIKPTSGFRLFGSLQAGDKIIDLFAPLKRITNPGATTLALGSVTDTFAFLKANRGLSDSDKANAEDVDTELLKNAVIVIDGEEWVQQEIGEELIKCWDAEFAGIRVSQSFHVRRSA